MWDFVNAKRVGNRIRHEKKIWGIKIFLHRFDFFFVAVIAINLKLSGTIIQISGKSAHTKFVLQRSLKKGHEMIIRKLVLYLMQGESKDLIWKRKEI